MSLVNTESAAFDILRLLFVRGIRIVLIVFFVGTVISKSHAVKNSIQNDIYMYEMDDDDVPTQQKQEEAEILRQLTEMVVQYEQQDPQKQRSILTTAAIEHLHHLEQQGLLPAGQGQQQGQVQQVVVVGSGNKHRRSSISGGSRKDTNPNSIATLLDGTGIETTTMSDEELDELLRMIGSTANTELLHSAPRDADTGELLVSPEQLALQQFVSDLASAQRQQERRSHISTGSGSTNNHKRDVQKPNRSPRSMSSSTSSSSTSSSRIQQQHQQRVKEPEPPKPKRGENGSSSTPTTTTSTTNMASSQQQPTQHKMQQQLENEYITEVQQQQQQHQREVHSSPIVESEPESETSTITFNAPILEKSVAMVTDQQLEQELNIVDPSTYHMQERQLLLRIFDILIGKTQYIYVGYKHPWKVRNETNLKPAHTTYHCTEWPGITCGKVMVHIMKNSINNSTTSIYNNYADGQNNEETTLIPIYVVQEMTMNKFGLNGTIPGTLIQQLPYLKVFDVSYNFLYGTVPFYEFSQLRYLTKLHVHQNYFLSGTIPITIDHARINHLPIPIPPQQLQQQIPLLPNLVDLGLSYNSFSGTVMLPNDQYLSKLRYFDASNNLFTGPLIKVPHVGAEEGTSRRNIDTNHNNNLYPVDDPRVSTHVSPLQFLVLSHNAMTGTIPDFITQEYPNLVTLDLSMNGFTSINDTTSTNTTTPDNFVFPKIPNSLWDLLLNDNRLAGPFLTTNLWDSSYLGKDSPPLQLQMISLSNNLFTGRIPHEGWNKINTLGVLYLDHNRFTGELPVALFTGQAHSLGSIDLSQNKLSGTIPSEIAVMNSLHMIDAMSNQLTGQIPNEMIHMNPNLRLNFTDNFLTGTIPSLFCGHGASSMNMLYREFGCDAVLCPPGTFHRYGHATLHAACRPCPDVLFLDEDDDNYYLKNVLGRTSCKGLVTINGDVNGDGILSPREVLRLIYVDTIGRFWGSTYQTWADIKVNECELLGITCVNGQIARIDLSNAEMCSNGDHAAGPVKFCRGLPNEIGELSTLEVFQLKSQQFLRGSIPTEIGKLTGLRLLDISSCSLMAGTLPSEIGKLTKLKRLILSHSRFKGTIPSEIMSLSGLEKLHLTNNNLVGTLPALRKLKNLKEFMIARNHFTGTISTKIGYLSSLENFEAYHNRLSGTLPKQLALPNLKRIDVLGNRITGSIPEEFAKMESLQILHLKSNLLTGTIPEGFAHLQELSWFDVSQNHLLGTIPEAFVHTPNLIDFRVAGNMLYGTIPEGLCNNPTLNSGQASQHGCSGLLCPPGTYSELGYQKNDIICQPCPPDQTNFYLGSFGCIYVSEMDILSILYESLDGMMWPHNVNENWGDYNVPLCDWSGIDCDPNGKTTGIRFPSMTSMYD